MANKQILLYGGVGPWEINGHDFQEDIKDLGEGDTAELYIYSGGGSVFEGFNIYSQMKRSKATFTAYIDGMAASIATVIAMGADKIKVSEGSMMMIHEAWGMAVGGKEDMEEQAEALDKINAEIRAVYKKKTGMSDEELKDLMAQDRYLTSQELIEFGFADELDETPIEIAAKLKTTMKNEFKNHFHKGAHMAEEKAKVEATEPVEAPEAKAEITQADIDKAVADALAKAEVEKNEAVEEALKAKAELEKSIEASKLHEGQNELIASLKAEAGMTLDKARAEIIGDFQANKSEYLKTSVDVKAQLQAEAAQPTLPQAEAVKEVDHKAEWKSLKAQGKFDEAAHYHRKHIKGVK
jgi:ATP-dependent Clp endopeptidase proteolytic subunit ClpP